MAKPDTRTDPADDEQDAMPPPQETVTPAPLAGNGFHFPLDLEHEGFSAKYDQRNFWPSLLTALDPLPFFNGFQKNKNIMSGLPLQLLRNWRYALKVVRRYSWDIDEIGGDDDVALLREFGVTVGRREDALGLLLDRPPWGQFIPDMNDGAMIEDELHSLEIKFMFGPTRKMLGEIPHAGEWISRMLDAVGDYMYELWRAELIRHRELLARWSVGAKRKFGNEKDGRYWAQIEKDGTLKVWRGKHKAKKWAICKGMTLEAVVSLLEGYDEWCWRDASRSQDEWPGDYAARCEECYPSKCDSDGWVEIFVPPGNDPGKGNAARNLLQKSRIHGLAKYVEAGPKAKGRCLRRLKKWNRE